MIRRDNISHLSSRDTVKYMCLAIGDVVFRYLTIGDHEMNKSVC